MFLEICGMGVWVWEGWGETGVLDIAFVVQVTLLQKNCKIKVTLK